MNGGLFRDALPLPKLSLRSRNAIIKNGELNWADINPDIFGSMMQGVVNEDERTELGMHYYLLLDVFLLGIFMLRKAVNPLSSKKALLC